MTTEKVKKELEREVAIAGKELTQSFDNGYSKTSRFTETIMLKRMMMAGCSFQQENVNIIGTGVAD